MSARRSAVWGFVAMFAALGVLSFFGDRFLFYAYIATFIPLTVLHAIRFCPRCSNVACAFNPRSEEFFLRRGPGSQGAARGQEASRLPVLATAAPMSLSGMLAFFGAWKFEPVAAMAVAAAAVPVHLVYRANSCRYCTNRCPAADARNSGSSSGG